MASQVETQLAADFVQNQMEIPKSPVGVFDLPCGVLIGGELITEVQLREITGEEEDMLGAANMDGTKKVTQLIGGCLERLGTITDKGQLLALTREMSIGDRAFLLLAIRRVTLGDSVPIDEKCPECKKGHIYHIDLSTLEVRKMANPKQRVYDVKLPSGSTARYHVMTGKDDETLSKMAQRDKPTGSIFVRLDQLDANPVTFDQVRALSLKDRTFLRDQFDGVEGGVETEVETTCNSCGHEFEFELNPGSTGFFFPSRVHKKSKRSTSSS